MDSRYERGEEMGVEPEPWLFRKTSLRHYYGDTVRVLLLAAAIAMLVGAPFYTNNLHAELPLYIVGMLVLVCLAAFTSPRNKSILIIDTIVAGAGVLYFETWALSSYGADSMIAFTLRQTIALIFFFALYFGGKTVRALIVEPEKEARPDAPDFSSDEADAERAKDDDEQKRLTRHYHYEAPDEKDD